MHASGEKHYRAKLSDERVREIRNTWHAWKAAGEWKGYKSLAIVFGISPWTARDLVTYRTRKGA
jgi:hypothetical protein